MHEAEALRGIHVSAKTGAGSIRCGAQQQLHQ